MRTRVAIAGGGPAGAAAGMALARAGIEACVIEPGARAKAGECLYPRAMALIRQTGLVDPSTEGHRASPGMRVTWTGPAEDRDFIAHPEGAGWNLDRERFETGLRARAEREGVRWIEVRLTGATRTSGGFDLVLDGATLSAEAVIDASGRIACFARRMGAKRVIEDRLIAVHSVYEGGVEDPRLFVESAAEGWWYSCGLADCTIASFQTRAAEHAPLDPPPLTGARIAGLKRIRTQRFAAGSARLDQIAGDGWLAIGDAACAHDPLSGHGIMAALASGFDGGEAIAQWLAGEKDALARHAALRTRAWAEYREGIKAQYAAARATAPAG
ncbi:MAG: NAD(P)/FAD-dependent oxidoreductase [Hyphomonadaceae bacterium]